MNKTDTRTGWAIHWERERGCGHFVGILAYSHDIPPHMHPYRTIVFETRAEARKFIAEKYGYIRNRPDLRGSPHWWRMPKPVKVNVTVSVVAAPEGGEQ